MTAYLVKFFEASLRESNPLNMPCSIHSSALASSCHFRYPAILPWVKLKLFYYLSECGWWFSKPGRWRVIIVSRSVHHISSAANSSPWQVGNVSRTSVLTVGREGEQCCVKEERKEGRGREFEGGKGRAARTVRSPVNRHHHISSDLIIPMA